MYLKIFKVCVLKYMNFLLLTFLLPELELKPELASEAVVTKTEVKLGILQKTDVINW